MERFDFVPDWLAAVGQQQQAPSGREINGRPEQSARQQRCQRSKARQGWYRWNGKPRKESSISWGVWRCGAPRNPRWRLETGEGGRRRKQRGRTKLAVATRCEIWMCGEATPLMRPTSRCRWWALNRHKLEREQGNKSKQPQREGAPAPSARPASASLHSPAREGRPELLASEP